MREPFHTLMWKASIGYNDSWSQIDPEVLEKFAELIVRECIDICNKGISTDTDWDNSYWNQACENRAYAIKEHFGVEE